MKHVLVFVGLAVAIFFLATRKSDTDILMTPAKGYSETQVGSRFVELDPKILPVKPKFLSEQGVITVVYFRDPNCQATPQMDQELEQLIRVRPDVAIRKVEMHVINRNGDIGYLDAIMDYQTQIWTSPFIHIYDKNGKLIAGDDRTDKKGYDLLRDWIRMELEKEAKQKKI